MAGPATILREIHRLRRHAADLEREIERQPLRLKGQQAKLAAQEEALRQGHEDLKHLKVTSHDKEVELKTTHQHIDKHERQLNEAGSKKEYDALKAEIAADKKKCLQLEDEILDTMARTEDLTARIPELERVLVRAKTDYAEFEKSSKERLGTLSEQLEKTRKTIDEVEFTLPEATRAQYERLVAARGEDALAAVQNQTCMACYTGITAQSFNDLSLGQLVFCKSCGRALYLPE
jgi:predicted  nucleic acid-binding Zn-ribbon protein